MDTARTPDPQDRDEPVGGADAAADAGEGADRVPAAEPAETARPVEARADGHDDLPESAHQDDEPVFTVPIPARGTRTAAASRTTAAAMTSPPPSMPPPSGPPLAPATAAPVAAGSTAAYGPWSAPAPAAVAPPAPPAPAAMTLAAAAPAPAAAVAVGPARAAGVPRDEPSDAVSLWNLGLVLLGLTIGYWFFAGIRFLAYLVEVGPTDRAIDETIDMVAVETVAAAVVSVLAAVCLGLSRMKRERSGGGAAFAWSIGLCVLTVLTAVWRLV